MNKEANEICKLIGEKIRTMSDEEARDLIEEITCYCEAMEDDLGNDNTDEDDTESGIDLLNDSDFGEE